tara:strand:+ start:244 stop:735 length:492 start_codon:yes stop_codon:yes gene_type:complete
VIEVVAALGAASSAFNAIKKGFEVGRDIESMSNDLGRWMGAVSDIKKAEEFNKRPPLFKKLFAAGSVEEEAMQIFMAKKKAEDMRYQLKQLISLTRGPAAWDDLLKTEGEIRKRRQRMIYDQQERRKEILNAIGIIFLVGCIGGLLAMFLGIMIDMYGHPRTW